MSINTDMQLRHAFQVTSGATPSSGNGEYWDGHLLWVTPQDLSDMNDYWLVDTQRKISESGYRASGTIMAPIHSIVLSKRAPIGQLAILKKPACSNQGCFILIPRIESDSRFFLYWLSCQTKCLQALGRGSTFMELSTDDLKSVRVPSLAPSRQCAIADYLDRETAKLDALVAAKERVLELLAERRQALIAAAVTGIIDSAGRTKRLELDALDEEESLHESGTNRRGNRASSVGDDEVNIAVVTAEVSRRKLKHLASVNDDLLDENTDEEFEMQYIDIGNVDSSGRISEMSSFRFGDAPSRARRLVRDGDVIISTVRTYLQAITQIRNPPDNLVVSTGFAVVRPRQDRFDARYCRFTLREPTFLAEVEKRSVGANYPAINVTDLADILIPVHSLPQQRVIADYLDRETARLDTLEVKIQGTIALLKERRAAVIAAAVTGQIDVESVA